MNLLFVALLGLSAAATVPSSIPRFQQYPATEELHGRMMPPRIITLEERRFRTELHQAITKGYDVVDGGTEHERRGPNFAGHYVLVQWGCGSSCMEGALIDADTGQVLRLPQIPRAEQTGFAIPVIELQSMQFRTDSRLLAIPYIGDSNTYYYVLEQGHWRFLKKMPTAEQE
jgi:hypothetical protein